ncbi:hypothetical protein ABW636_22425 [Aquimarina sp. 2201CG1-2-11]|uniref:hypothetical protein n=1 Tax=Aquimarina discodermiae TaxID=3231043 RepID=UPI003462688F
MLNLKKIETIKSELILTNNSTISFPKKITFKFPEIYKILVTNIKTTEISAECILFNSVKSVNESKEFSDLDYWNKEFEIDDIKDYWFFGANGQGDSWILHQSDKVFFYDHNNGEISKENLIDLELSFDKWLQFAFLNRQFEEIDYNESLTQDLKNVYKSKLLELSNGLAKNYPFEI